MGTDGNNRNQAVETLLQVTGLQKDFYGVRAVDDVSLSLRKGGIYGLIGTNGAGKSTVVNILSGSQKADKGVILFEGKHMEHASQEQAAKRGIARTFQNLRIFPELTVLENVCIASQLHAPYQLYDLLLFTRRWRAAERQTLEESRKVLKQLRLEQYADQKAGALPYGLMRRLEIARCLAIRPKLLLLDEPAAGMNPGESLQLVRDIREIHEQNPDLTILLIEHDMKVIMSLCEYIFTMASGQLLFQGTPEEVRNSDKVIQVYLGGGHRAAS